jgi:hypothetical protein
MFYHTVQIKIIFPVRFTSESKGSNYPVCLQHMSSVLHIRCDCKHITFNTFKLCNSRLTLLVYGFADISSHIAIFLKYYLLIKQKSLKIELTILTVPNSGSTQIHIKVYCYTNICTN